MTHETESGFTLIEVLMAMVVLAIGLLALGMMQAYFAEGITNSRQITHASDVGTSKIEELANATNLSAGTYNETNSEYPLDYVLTWNVTNDTTKTGETVHNISLRVDWTTGNQAHEVNYNWVRAK